MSIQEIIKNSFSGGAFCLPVEKLNSSAITKISQDFFPKNTIQLSPACPAESPEGSHFIVKGTGLDYPFKGFQVTIDFYNLDLAEAQFVFTATAPETWRLSDGLPPFKLTLADAFVFASQGNPATFTLFSEKQDGRAPGLYFQGGIDLEKMTGGIAGLLGIKSIPIAGTVVIKENGSKLYTVDFEANPIKNIDLGIAKLQDVTFGIKNELIYNPLDEEYVTYPFIEMASKIPFQTNDKNYKLPIAVRISHFKSDIRFLVDITDLVNVGLDELAGLTNDTSLAAFLPKDGFHIEEYIDLHELFIDYNLPNNKVSLIGLTIKNTNPWKIYQFSHSEGALQVQSMSIAFRLMDPFGQKMCRVGVSGEIAIGESGILIVNANYPEWNFQGYLKEGTKIKVGELTKEFCGSNVGENFDIDLISLDISANEFSVKAGVVGEWTVTNFFSIERLKFHIDNKKGQASAFYFEGLFAVAGVEVFVSADNTDKEKGWQFKGSTGAGQAIAIGSLITDICGKFGIKDAFIPEPIKKLTFSNLGITYSTNEKNFTFTGEAKFPIGDIPIDIIVDIELKNGSGAYTKKFNGRLIIGSQVFTLDFKSNPSGSVLSGSWKTTGKPLEFKDIAEGLGFSDLPVIPDGLDLSLIDAKFEYTTANKEFSMSATSKNYGTAFFTTVKGTSNKTGCVFGLGINHAINLSRLPIIGDKLPAADCVSVKNLEILYCSAQLDEFEDPVYKTKSPLEKGLYFKGVIDIKDSPKEVRIGLFGEKKESAVGPAGDKAVEKVAGKMKKEVIRDAKADSGGSTTWIQVQKKIGPINFKRIGFGYDKGAVRFSIDAALSLAGLIIDLKNLALNFPLKNPSDIGVSLAGLDISYRGGTVEIEAGFLKVPDKEEYNGQAVIRAASFSISAIGSYADCQGDPSLFIFAVLNYPLGGPPFFFIKGLAAGFGYNRKLNIPELNDVKDFPLVKAALGEKGAITSDAAPEDALKAMGKHIAPSIGDNWLAAGVLFTSFETINSFALLTVSFGTHVEIVLLGLSKMGLPAGAPKPAAYVEMAFSVRFTPDSGLIAAAALLTPASYIFSKDCRLTGGFAFYMWYGGPHAGDFVVTIGGYHPSFAVPDHYPVVPRLGFNWHVSDQIQIKGECYFALTPSCVMAGGALDAEYHSGNLRAWFRAHADFLIQWKPFHYDITIGVSVGASYRVHWWFVDKTFSIELGAALHLWGPEFSGTARIKWFIISFTISFGAGGSQEAPKLKWPEFCDSFIPKMTKEEKKPGLLKAGASGEQELKVCAVKIEKGLIAEITQSDRKKQWIINSDQFLMTTHSFIPSTSMLFNGKEILTAEEKANKKYNTDLSIKPMGTEMKLNAVHDVNIQYQNEKGKWEDLPEGYLRPEVATENVADALWGTVQYSGPQAKTIENVPVGVKLTPVPVTYYSVPHNGFVDLNKLKYTSVDGVFCCGDGVPPDNEYDQKDDWKEAIKDFKNSIMRAEVDKLRKDIIEALSHNGAEIDKDINLNGLAKEAENILTAPPLFAVVGSRGI